MTASAPPLHWTWPRIRKRPALALLALFVAIGLWQGINVWLAESLDGAHRSLVEPLFEELTGALSVYPLLPLPLVAALNAPRPAGNWPRFLAIHFVAFVPFAPGHTAIMLGWRFAMHPMLGLGPYHYSNLRLHLPMEWQRDFISYCISVVIFRLAITWRERQQSQVREAELEGELRSAQLAALSAQLDPHFLFNALNTVSSLMYEDLARTDTLLSDLGLLLRRSLEQGRGPTWQFSEERAHTERFAALLLARFGDRLAIHWNIGPGVEQMQVPRFALQRLVENALKHNPDALTRSLEISIRAELQGEHVRLRVEDAGKGFGAEPVATGPGVGLENLRRSLALLFGAEARLETGNGAQTGAWVELRFPARRDAQPMGAPA